MWKKYIFLVLILIFGIIIIFLAFNWDNYFKNKKVEINIIDKPLFEILEKEVITLSIQDDDKIYDLIKQIEKIIISKNLRPQFIIEVNQKVDNLEIYFDNLNKDLLKDNSLNVVIERERNENLRINFKYTLEPQKHKIVIKYDKNGEKIKEEYNFLLILYDDFSQPLNQSKLWGLADSAKPYNNWLIQDGKLIANPLPLDAGPNAISSLFFIRRFHNDFFVQFDFSLKSDNIAFLVYLLQRNLNFFFGVNSNKNMMILNKPDTKANFVFEKLKTYQIRLIRNKNIYKVFVTTDKNFTKDDLFIIYEDKDGVNVPFDAFGFTIWQKSGGIEIDNFYTANEDISQILDLYGK